MVFRMKLQFDGIVYILDLKNINPSFQENQLPPGVYEIGETNNILPSSITISNDENRFEKASTVQCDENEVKVRQKIIFNSILGSTKKEKSKGKKMGEKLIITQKDRFHLKSDRIYGRIINGKRQAILYNFDLNIPVGHKVAKSPIVKQYLKKQIQTKIHNILF